jgi:hypothetical protein
MGNNPFLLVTYSNFLIKVRKDGQAARTQMQLAQKADPSLLDNYSIYVAQQLAKAVKRGIVLHLRQINQFDLLYDCCSSQRV